MRFHNYKTLPGLGNIDMIDNADMTIQYIDYRNHTMLICRELTSGMPSLLERG